MWSKGHIFLQEVGTLVKKWSLIWTTMQLLMGVIMAHNPAKRFRHEREGGFTLTWKTCQTRCAKATLWISEGSVVRRYKKVREGPRPHDSVRGPTTPQEIMIVTTVVHKWTLQVVFAMHLAHVCCHACGYPGRLCCTLILVGHLKGHEEV